MEIVPKRKEQVASLDWVRSGQCDGDRWCGRAGATVVRTAVFAHCDAAGAGGATVYNGRSHSL